MAGLGHGNRNDVSAADIFLARVKEAGGLHYGRGGETD